MRAILLGAAVLAAASSSTAAAPTVSALVVRPEAKCLRSRYDPKAPEPKVVATFPAQDAVVRPGLLVVRVTFDRPMTCSGSFDEAPPLPSPCPAQSQQVVMSLDRRTVRTLCRARPGARYALRLGGETTGRFVSLAGRRAAPYELRFSTSDAEPVRSIPDALAQDPAGARSRRERR